MTAELRIVFFGYPSALCGSLILHYDVSYWQKRSFTMWFSCKLVATRSSENRNIVLCLNKILDSISKQVEQPREVMWPAAAAEVFVVKKPQTARETG